VGKRTLPTHDSIYNRNLILVIRFLLLVIAMPLIEKFSFDAMLIRLINYCGL
jgi:hypothetical protein